MAKGGGAWKVAYADFVTAMMAFFLVMWICAQDQKIKQAVARYFVNPIGIMPTGASKTPDRTGALFPLPAAGSVPGSETVAMGRGRVPHTQPKEFSVSSTATKSVSDWIHGNETDERYWRTQVQLARALAGMSNELLNKSNDVDDVATRQLEILLKSEITRGVFSEINGLSQDLLSTVLSEVNWTELAEDLLSNYGAADEGPP